MHISNDNVHPKEQIRDQLYQEKRFQDDNQWPNTMITGII